MSIENISRDLMQGISRTCEAIVEHLSSETRSAILGDYLASKMGRGSGKTLISLALHADALRVVFDTIFADGDVTDDELDGSMEFLIAMAVAFAKVRSDYSTPENPSRSAITKFLDQYKSDDGTFGYRDDNTKWTGLDVCKNTEGISDAASILAEFRNILMQAAVALSELNGMSKEESEFLERLAIELGVHDGNDREDRHEDDDEYWDTGDEGRDDEDDDDELSAEDEEEWEGTIDADTDDDDEYLEDEDACEDTDTETKRHYMEVSPTGRLKLQSNSLAIEYSQSGWYEDASCGINVMSRSPEESGIASADNEISEELFQRALACVRHQLEKLLVSEKS